MDSDYNINNDDQQTETHLGDRKQEELDKSDFQQVRNSQQNLQTQDTPSKNDSESSYQMFQTPNQQNPQGKGRKLYKLGPSSQKANTSTKDSLQQTLSTDVATRTNLNSASTRGSSTKLISVVDFDPNSDVEPIINSPRSLQACQLAGFPPDTLIKKLVLPLEKQLATTAYLTEEGIWMVSEHQEKKRQDRVNKVIEYRNKIMADVLSKEERKTLQESQFFIMGESRISTSTRPSSRNLNGCRTETQLGQTSPDFQKVEKTRQQQIKGIETMIGEELKINLLYNSMNEKQKRLWEIEQHKIWQHQQRRQEAEEFEKQKKERLQQHMKNEQQTLLSKDEKIQLRQSITAHNVCVIRELREKQLQEEAKKLKEKQELALLSIQEQKEQRQQKVETSYWRKHENFVQKHQQRQDEIEEMCAIEKEKKDLSIQQKREIRERLIQNRIDTVRSKLEQKYNQVEEKQKMVEEIRRGDSAHRNLRARDDKPKRIQSATALNSNTSIDPKYHHLPLEVAKELQIKDRAQERKLVEEEVMNRKIMLQQQLAKQIEQEYLMRQNQSSSKLQNLDESKHNHLIRVRSQHMMRSLNAQDNSKRVEYIKSNKNAAILDKMAAWQQQKQYKEYEAMETSKERESTYNKLSIEKQKIKDELEKLFQKCKRVNVPQISQKYSIQLESEDKLLSKSMADIGKPRSFKKFMSSPYKNQTQLSQTSINGGNY